jgi:hypothetical protein
MAQDEIADVLQDALISPNVADRNGEAANLVDALDNLARAMWSVSRGIDECSMSIGLGLKDIASAIKAHNDRH